MSDRIQFQDGSYLTPNIGALMNTAMDLSPKMPKDPKTWAEFLAAKTIIGFNPNMEGRTIFYGIENLREYAEGKAVDPNSLLMLLPYDPAEECGDTEVIVELCNKFKGGNCYRSQITLPQDEKAYSKDWKNFGGNFGQGKKT